MNRPNRILMLRPRQGTLSVLITLALLGGCGRQNTSWLDESESTVRMTFTQWCSNWHLECPNGKIPGAPREDLQWSQQQWGALSAVINGFLNTPSHVAVTGAQAADAEIKQALEALQLDEWHRAFLLRMNDDHFQKVEVVNGQIILHSNETSSLTGSSGLNIEMGSLSKISIGADTRAEFSGFFGSSAASGGKRAIKSVNVTGANIVDMTLDDLVVSETPIMFMLNDTMKGFDSNSWIKTQLELPQIGSAVGPLLSFIKRLPLNVTLNQTFLDLVAQKAPMLMPFKNQWSDAFFRIVSALSSVKIGQSAAPQLNALTQRAGVTIRCEVRAMGLKININPQQEFGVKAVERLADGTYRIEFYGIKTSMFGINLTLKRVDMKPDAVIVLDVPLIRSLRIGYADLGDINKIEINCRK